MELAHKENGEKTKRRPLVEDSRRNMKDIDMQHEGYRYGKNSETNFDKTKPAYLNPKNSKQP